MDSNSPLQPPQRYQGLFKYCRADTALLCLQQGRLRWSSPLSFNDPLDTQFDPAAVLRTHDFEELFRDHFRRVFIGTTELPGMAEPAQRLRRRLMEMPPADRAAAAERELAAAIEHFRTNRDALELYYRALRRLRMLCMASDPVSLLMWSHYGDNHRRGGIEVPWRGGIEIRASRNPRRWNSQIEESTRLRHYLSAYGLLPTSL